MTSRITSIEECDVGRGFPVGASVQRSNKKSGSMEGTANEGRWENSYCGSLMIDGAARRSCNELSGPIHGVKNSHRDSTIREGIWASWMAPCPAVRNASGRRNLPTWNKALQNKILAVQHSWWWPCSFWWWCEVLEQSLSNTLSNGERDGSECCSGISETTCSRKSMQVPWNNFSIDCNRSIGNWNESLVPSKISWMQVDRITGDAGIETGAIAARLYWSFVPIVTQLHYSFCRHSTVLLSRYKFSVFFFDRTVQKSINRCKFILQLLSSALLI